ncbi:hypothetical protein [Novosphingobium olei]|uniref:hypothetical protein n=1 Tax=Novosphingobium olei TaxID=2728851 RepID=UPI003084F18C|nr:hypothetical protein NSDW_00630 [Novosphingobium olei]
MSRSQPADRAPSRSARQPVTAHRLFPALVALWLAALFGLGSFAVPSSLFERALTAANVASVVPAAAPPLGLTARLLIAMAMAAGGLIVGVFVGLRLRPRSEPVVRRRTASASFHDVPEVVEDEAFESNEPPAVRAFDAHPDAPPRKPFDLSEALAFEPPYAEAAEAEADEVLDVAGNPEPWMAEHPAPSADHDILEADWTEVEPFEAVDQTEDAPVEADVPEWSEVAETAEPLDHAPEVAPEPVSQPVLEAEEPAAQIAPEPIGHRASVFAMPPVTPRPVAPALAVAPLESLGLVQLIERLALAIEGDRRKGPHAHAMAVAPAPVAPVQVTAPVPLVDETPPEPVAERQVFVSPDPAPAEAAAETVVEAPQVFEEQVSEEPSAAAAVSEDASGPVQPPAHPVSTMRPPRLFGAPEHGPRDPGESDRDTTMVRQPAAMRALEPNWDEAGESAEADVVVPRFLSVPPVNAAPSSHASSVSPLDRPPFVSSLAARSSAAPRQEFIVPPAPADEAEVRPVVVFPGQGPRAAGEDEAHVAAQAPTEPSGAEETERALRAALATLQRMTARG